MRETALWIMGSESSTSRSNAPGQMNNRYSEQRRCAPARIVASAISDWNFASDFAENAAVLACLSNFSASRLAASEVSPSGIV